MGIVREARSEDAFAIGELSLQLGHSQTTIEQRHQRLQNLLRSAHDYVWVYHIENQLYGWLHAFKAQRLASDAFFEIGGLVVSESASRQGVGRALMQVAQLHAQTQKMNLTVRCNAKRRDRVEFYSVLGLRRSKLQEVFGSEPS